MPLPSTSPQPGYPQPGADQFGDETTPIDRLIAFNEVLDKAEAEGRETSVPTGLLRQLEWLLLYARTVLDDALLTQIKALPSLRERERVLGEYQRACRSFTELRLRVEHLLEK